MSHFGDEIWADMARGSLSQTEAASVTSHVESGCLDCARMLRTWKAVAGILKSEREYEPPDEVLRSVRGLFAPERGKQEGGAARIAELIFDSFASPAPAGMRSLERSSRQLCFQTGNFLVDLRIEEHPGASKASVLGQLMRLPYDERVRLEGLDVTLSSGASSLERTTTNHYGEFHLEVPTEGDHNIAVGLGEGFAMVLTLRSIRSRDQ